MSRNDHTVVATGLVTTRPVDPVPYAALDEIEQALRESGKALDALRILRAYIDRQAAATANKGCREKAEIPDEAVQAVITGRLRISEAAQAYRVNASTLRDRVREATEK